MGKQSKKAAAKPDVSEESSDDDPTDYTKDDDPTDCTKDDVQRIMYKDCTKDDVQRIMYKGLCTKDDDTTDCTKDDDPTDCTDCDDTYTNAKMILTIANIICMFAGLAMMVFGFFAYWKPEYLFTFMGKIQGVSEIPVTFDLGGIFKASAVFLIVVGTFIAKAGMFGTCGDKKTKLKLLIGYVVILSILILIELVAIVFIAAFPDKLKEISQNVMNKSLVQFQKDISFQDGRMRLPNNAFSLGWTVLQLEANCCGAYNFTDYSEWLRNVTINGVTRSAAVPISCCKKNESLSLVSTPSFNVSIFTNLDGCLDGDYAYMNQKNCFDSALNNIYKNRKTYIGIVAAVIALETLMIILFVVLYCNNMKNERKEKRKKKKKKEKEKNVVANIPQATNIRINFVLADGGLKMPFTSKQLSSLREIEAANKEQETRVYEDGY